QLSPAGDPTLLDTVVALRERQLMLALTTCDPLRMQGGLWTTVAASRSLVAWQQGTVAAPQLAGAAGAWLAPAATALLDRCEGDARALVLAALGALGEELALEPLTAELIQGALPGAAAVGLARLGT